MADIYDVVEQHDGRLLFTGWSGSNIAICRVTPDGAADLSFGSSNGCTGLEAEGAGVQIEIAGDAIYLLGWDSPGFLVVRLDGSGRLDTAFGEAGIVRVDSPRVAHPHAMLVLDHSVVVGGRFDDTGEDAFLSQVTDEGGIGPFGTDGFVTFRDAGAHRHTTVYGLAAHPGGGFIATTGRALHSFMADGSRVQNFGSNGVLELPFWATALAETADFLFAGGDGTALRIAWTGTVDGTSARIPAVGIVRDLEVMPDGSIVMAGAVRNGSEENTFGIGRLDPDGQPDDAFGVGGASYYWVGTDARALVVLQDGRYLLAGTFGVDSGCVIRVWN